MNNKIKEIIDNYLNNNINENSEYFERKYFLFISLYLYFGKNFNIELLFKYDFSFEFYLNQIKIDLKKNIESDIYYKKYSNQYDFNNFSYSNENLYINDIYEKITNNNNFQINYDSFFLINYIFLTIYDNEIELLSLKKFLNAYFKRFIVHFFSLNDQLKKQNINQITKEDLIKLFEYIFSYEYKENKELEVISLFTKQNNFLDINDVNSNILKYFKYINENNTNLFYINSKNNENLYFFKIIFNISSSFLYNFNTKIIYQSIYKLSEKIENTNIIKYNDLFLNFNNNNEEDILFILENIQYLINKNSNAFILLKLKDIISYNILNYDEKDKTNDLYLMKELNKNIKIKHENRLKILNNEFINTIYILPNKFNNDKYFDNPVIIKYSNDIKKNISIYDYSYNNENIIYTEKNIQNLINDEKYHIEINHNDFKNYHFPLNIHLIKLLNNKTNIIERLSKFCEILISENLNKNLNNNIKFISENNLSSEIEKKKINISQLTNYEELIFKNYKFIFQSGILISFKNDNYKVNLLDNQNKDIFSIDKGILFIIIKDEFKNEISLDYIYYYFYDEYVISQLKLLFKYEKIEEFKIFKPSIYKLIDDIYINIPSIEEQDKYIKNKEKEIYESIKNKILSFNNENNINILNNFISSIKIDIKNKEDIKNRLKSIKDIDSFSENTKNDIQQAVSLFFQTKSDDGTFYNLSIFPLLRSIERELNNKIINPIKNKLKNTNYYYEFTYDENIHKYSKETHYNIKNSFCNLNGNKNIMLGQFNYLKKNIDNYKNIIPIFKDFYDSINDFNLFSEIISELEKPLTKDGDILIKKLRNDIAHALVNNNEITKETFDKLFEVLLKEPYALLLKINELEKKLKI